MQIEAHSGSKGLTITGLEFLAAYLNISPFRFSHDPSIHANALLYQLLFRRLCWKVALYVQSS